MKAKNSILEKVSEMPYGELGVWEAIYILAEEIDKLKGPMYGPAVEEGENDS